MTRRHARAHPVRTPCAASPHTTSTDTRARTHKHGHTQPTSQHDSSSEVLADSACARQKAEFTKAAQLLACSRRPHTCMMRDNTFEVVALVRARRLRTHASSRKRARSGHSFGIRGKQVCADGWRWRYACSQRAHGLAHAPRPAPHRSVHSKLLTPVITLV